MSAHTASDFASAASALITSHVESKALNRSHAALLDRVEAFRDRALAFQQEANALNKELNEMASAVARLTIGEYDDESEAARDEALLVNYGLMGDENTIATAASREADAETETETAPTYAQNYARLQEFLKTAKGSEGPRLVRTHLGLIGDSLSDVIDPNGNWRESQAAATPVRSTTGRASAAGSGTFVLNISRNRIAPGATAFVGVGSTEEMQAFLRSRNNEQR